MTTTHTTVGGSSSVQAMFEWEPSSADLYVGTGVGFYSDDITSLTLNMETLGYALIIYRMGSLVTASFPNLLSVDEDGQLDSEFQISGCEALTSVSFPKLEIVGGALSISGNTNLASIDLTALEEANGLSIESATITSLDLSALVTIGGSGLYISGCPNLESIDISSLVPTSGWEYRFHENALTADCVNAILARFVANAEFVSGTINVGVWEGTNAAPTGQGLLDCATLTARGVSVTANVEPG
jgi:hypothetical protein